MEEISSRGLLVGNVLEAVVLWHELLQEVGLAVNKLNEY